MDFTTIGSLNSYAKNWRMKTQWELKKSSGDVNGHSPSLSETLNPRRTSAAALYQPALDALREDEEKETTLGDILNKISSGQKLTKQEEKILQAKDPATYQRYVGVEEDRKSYERELKRCKTKEEVQRLKMTHLNASLMTAKSIASNPHIPEQKKLVLLALEGRRVEKKEASTRAFVRRGEYAKLPTDSEKAKAERELREARDGTAAEKERTEKTKDGAEPSSTPETEKPPRRAEPAAVTRDDASARKMKRTEAEARETPEARKVRRAKAKAAFSAWNGGTEEDAAPLDVRA